MLVNDNLVEDLAMTVIILVHNKSYLVTFTRHTMALLIVKSDLTTWVH